jgi:hypothetical protein
METAPTLILYTVTGKSLLGEDRWADPSVPPYFFEDRDLARQALLDLRADLLAGRNPDDSALCLERIETVPMTAAAIVALLNDGFAAIVKDYAVIETIGED